jgi:Na+-driven multidrug efflux pump
MRIHCFPLLLFSANAFAPRLSNLKRTSFLVQDKYKILYGVDELQNSEELLDDRTLNDNLVENTVFSVPIDVTKATVTSATENSVADTGKIIFLSSMEENAEIVETTFEDNVSQKQHQSPKTPTPAEKTHIPAEMASLVMENQDELIAIKETNTAEGVRSLLTASEQAIVEAEAKFALQTAESEERTLSPSVPAPSVAKILKFAIPAIGVWLCGPLLSMIDTSCVGLLSGTAQQAALNPAVAVTDYTALLIAFLYTGTTNLIAAARETDAAVEGSPKTTSTFRGVLQLAWIVGLGLGGVLFVFAPHLLRAIIGNDSISPAVFDAAMKYVRIRALGMPAAAVIGSSQAACLGMQDIRSPLYVLGVAAIVNFLGDMMFVGNANLWIGGAAGAAWATVFSQYAAVIMFLYWLCNKRSVTTPPINLSESIMRLVKSKYGQNKGLSAGQQPIKLIATGEANVSVRGFLADKFNIKDFLNGPSRQTIQDFTEYIVPVTTAQVGRVSGYVAMSHVVSSSMGTLSMAAQQIIVSLFYCLCPIADSLNLTAQSFLPSIMEKKPSPERSLALRKASFNFAKAGGIFGAVMMSAVSCVPLLSRFFTTDLQVISLVNAVAPLLLVFFASHGIVCAMEGVLLGRKDLAFLGKMYANFFVVVPFLMLRVKKAALAGAAGVGIRSVWTVFIGYQLFRLVAWSFRAAHLQRQTEKQVAAP